MTVPCRSLAVLLVCACVVGGCGRDCLLPLYCDACPTFTAKRDELRAAYDLGWSDDYGALESWSAYRCGAYDVVADSWNEGDTLTDYYFLRPQGTLIAERWFFDAEYCPEDGRGRASNTMWYGTRVSCDVTCYYEGAGWLLGEPGCE